jgi:AhpD family alkylhydroperoxidase
MSEAQVRPGFLKAMESFDTSVGEPLEAGLREMLRLRCSHMNGCSFSVRMHSEALSGAGARPELISALARPVKLMREDAVTAGEAAALRFAEILTDPPRGLEIEARDEVSRHYAPPQVGAIVEVVALCNAWNRVTRGME